jgi:hypothetical protein
MTAALGTLPFLATLWLLMVLGSRVLEESGAKIAAALKGVPSKLPGKAPVQVRCRMPAGIEPARPANVEWRAAA